MRYERPWYIIALFSFWIVLVTAAMAFLIFGSIHFTVTAGGPFPITFFWIVMGLVWSFIVLRYLPKMVMGIETNGKVTLSLLNGERIVIQKIDSLKKEGMGIRMRYSGQSKNLDVYFFKNNKRLMNDLETVCNIKE